MNTEFSKKKILIVDDNPVNIRILGEALRSKYEIIFATIGKNALTIVTSENSPDIIITDINMPEMDGYQFVKIIRDMEKEKGGRLPVIGLTAALGKQAREKCLNAGMDECLDKVANTIDIEQKIDKLLSKSQAAKKIIAEKKPETPLLNKNAPLNIDSLRKKLGYNDLKVKEMLKWALEDMKLQLSLMEEAVKESEMTPIINSAHKSKGTSMNLEAIKLAETFKNIESMAEDRKLKMLPEQIEKAKADFGLLKEYLKQYE